MDDFWDQLDKSLKEAQKTLKRAAKEAEKAAHDAQQTIAQAAAQVHSAVAGGPTDPPLDLAAEPEHIRVAFYGALFAVAAADGALDKEELQLLFELIDLTAMSRNGRRAVQGYILQPPRLLDALQPLSYADDRLRYALMVNLADIAWAHDLVPLEQRVALDVSARELRISAEQLAAIEAFVGKLKQISERGLDDTAAAEMTKQAIAGLAAVGIPISVVYISGSVIGLSAAGITSGLAALGLGLGMVPGIGIGIGMGILIYVLTTNLLDAGGRRRQAQLRAAAERRVRQAIANFQEVSGLLSERIRMLERAGGDAANQETIRELNRRLLIVQQLLARSQRQAAAAEAR